MGHLRHRGDIDQGLHRVGGRLEEDRFRRLAQRLLPLREVGAIDEFGLNTPPRQNLVTHHKAGAEQAAARDQPITGAKKRTQPGEHRGHSGRRGERRLGAFDQP